MVIEVESSTISRWLHLLDLVEHGPVVGKIYGNAGGPQRSSIAMVVLLSTRLTLKTLPPRGFRQLPIADRRRTSFRLSRLDGRTDCRAVHLRLRSAHIPRCSGRGFLVQRVAGPGIVPAPRLPF